MYPSSAKSNHYIGQQLDKVSLQIRMTFIQEVMRKKYKFQCVSRPKIECWSAKGLRIVH